MRWRTLCLAALVWLAQAGNAWAELDPQLERHRQILDRSESIPPGDSADGRCRVCHADQLDYAPRRASPAGLNRDDARAPYQRLETYAGEQSSFHWRHRSSPYAREVMRMQCQSCHLGRDPGLPGLEADDPRFPVALRKRVNPVLCVNCHGQFPNHRAVFTGTWAQARGRFDSNCLVCHQADAARRHRSPLLAREEIERRGARSGDACYGCHGGRAWYAVSARAVRGQAYDLSEAATPPAESMRATPLTVR